MTSPRQRKKRAHFLSMKQKQEQNLLKGVVKVETKPVEPVAVTPPAVVESNAASKLKKPRNALVETKPQEQVVEQPKEEVKTVIEAPKVESKT